MTVRGDLVARTARRDGWVRIAAISTALLVVAAGGCGGDSDTGSTTTALASSSTAPTTTSPTTGPGTTTTTEPDLSDAPPLRDDAVSGSGCSPGPGDLPAGWWYGVTEGVAGGQLALDLACYYRGAAAEAEATKRGDEVNNDYYVVNDSPQIRTVPVADDATASCVELGAGVLSVDCSPDDVAGDWAVWIRVQGGEADRIVEQYAP
jgi:hypothetical protein